MTPVDPQPLVELPAAGRLLVADRPEGLHVVIERRPNASGVLLLGLWLVIWIPAGWFGAQSALNGDQGALSMGLMLWLVLWAVGIVFAVVSLLWHLGGREILVLDAQSLTYRAVAFGLGTRRVFRAADIRHLRKGASEFSLESTRRRGRYMPPWTTSYGALAFDYGGSTFRFAPSLDDPEAGRLCELLRARMPGA